MTNINPDTHFTELQNLAAGRIEALRYFYMVYAGRMRAFVYKLTNDMPLAEDITHNVFIQLWEQHARVLQIGSVEAYLFKMTRNATLNHMKHLEVERDYRDSLAPTSTTDDNSADELEAQITAAIDSMPSKQRRVFLMSRYSRMTYSEISQELGISPRTVQYHISEALASLRKALMMLCL